VSAALVEFDQLSPQRLGVTLDLIRQPAGLCAAEARRENYLAVHAFTRPSRMSAWTTQSRYASESSSLVSLRSTGFPDQLPFLSQPDSQQVS
jgi:hypothetical protein